MFGAGGRPQGHGGFRLMFEQLACGKPWAQRADSRTMGRYVRPCLGFRFY